MLLQVVHHPCNHIHCVRILTVEFRYTCRYICTVYFLDWFVDCELLSYMRTFLSTEITVNISNNPKIATPTQYCKVEDQYIYHGEYVHVPCMCNGHTVWLFVRDCMIQDMEFMHECLVCSGISYEICECTVAIGSAVSHMPCEVCPLLITQVVQICSCMMI